MEFSPLQNTRKVGDMWTSITINYRSWQRSELFRLFAFLVAVNGRYGIISCVELEMCIAVKMLAAVVVVGARPCVSSHWLTSTRSLTPETSWNDRTLSRSGDEHHLLKCQFLGRDRSAFISYIISSNYSPYLLIRSQ